MLDEITIRDIFDRPNWARAAKEAHELCGLIDTAICNYSNRTRERPMYLVLGQGMFHQIKCNSHLYESGHYHPTHCQRNPNSGGYIHGYRNTYIN